MNVWKICEFGQMCDADRNGRQFFDSPFYTYSAIDVPFKQRKSNCVYKRLLCSVKNDFTRSFNLVELLDVLVSRGLNEG